MALEVRAKPKPDPWEELRREGVPRQVIADWKLVRDKKRSPLTATALAAVRREADKARMTLATAVTYAVEHSWVGFKASWVERDRAAGHSLRERAAADRVNEMTGGLAGRKLPPKDVKEIE